MINMDIAHGISGNSKYFSMGRRLRMFYQPEIKITGPKIQLYMKIIFF